MTLQLVARDGDWLVFNEQAFRTDVVRCLWGTGFEPTINELYSRLDLTRRSGDLELPDDHWGLAQTAVAARADLYQRMRPEIRLLLDRLPDRAAGRLPDPPQWIPAQVWRQFLSSGDGVHRYSRASRYGTDIILIMREHAPFGGYAEMPTDVHTLYRLLHVAPPTELRRLLGAETGEQARVRWLADADRGFNQFMWRQVQMGIGPAQAYRNYTDAVHTQWLAAFLPLIGSFGASDAGAQAGDLLRAWNVIP
jgi:hypothetical protein